MGIRISLKKIKNIMTSIGCNSNQCNNFHDLDFFSYRCDCENYVAGGTENYEKDNGPQDEDYNPY